MDNKLQELIDLSPCPISFNEHALGYEGYFDRTENIIVVKNTGNLAAMFGILAHEVQHAKCQQFNCLCRKYPVDHHISEYHAYKAQIVCCLGYIPALKESIGLIQRISGFTQFPGHTKACKLLMKTKLWRKALKLCGFPLQ